MGVISRIITFVACIITAGVLAYVAGYEFRIALLSDGVNPSWIYWEQQIAVAACVIAILSALFALAFGSRDD